jgi:hypothetical protein
MASRRRSRKSFEPIRQRPGPPHTSDLFNSTVCMCADFAGLPQNAQTISANERNVPVKVKRSRRITPLLLFAKQELRHETRARLRKLANQYEAGKAGGSRSPHHGGRRSRTPPSRSPRNDAGTARRKAYFQIQSVEEKQGTAQAEEGRIKKSPARYAAARGAVFLSMRLAALPGRRSDRNTGFARSNARN